MSIVYNEIIHIFQQYHKISRRSHIQIDFRNFLLRFKEKHDIPKYTKEIKYVTNNFFQGLYMQQSCNH